MKKRLSCADSLPVIGGAAAGFAYLVKTATPYLATSQAWHGEAFGFLVLVGGLALVGKVRGWF